MVKNFMKISLPKLTINNKVICSVVVSFAEQLNPSAEEANEIYIAVSEAVDNCIRFAYPNNDKGIISVTCNILKDNVIKIAVKDSGVGIKDIEQALQPLYTTTTGNHSGIGFSIIESYMTAFKVTSKLGRGTTECMKKRIGK